MRINVSNFGGNCRFRCHDVVLRGEKRGTANSTQNNNNNDKSNNNKSIKKGCHCNSNNKRGAIAIAQQQEGSNCNNNNNSSNSNNNKSIKRGCHCNSNNS